MECGTYWIELYAKIKIIGGLSVLALVVCGLAAIFVPAIIRYVREK